MSAQYIIRLDDASGFMDYSKWNPYFDLFDKYNISPIIAVIPDNKDPMLVNNNPDDLFWDKVNVWQEKNYVIALHGYQHVYTNTKSGIMGINNYSEFVGLPQEKQLLMLSKGIEIFRKNGISTNMFVAPAHSFDRNTLRAIKQLNIRHISDGFFLNPKTIDGINWIPQQLWKPTKKKNGIWTICIHPETTDNFYFKNLENFIKNNTTNFTHPYSVNYKLNISIFEFLFNQYLSFRYKLIRIKNFLLTNSKK